jgi:hypothetical protein
MYSTASGMSLSTSSHAVHWLRVEYALQNKQNEYINTRTKTKLNSVALVRERTIPTERPPPVGEVSANFCG